MSFWKELFEDMANSWLVWREAAVSVWALLLPFLITYPAPSDVAALFASIVYAAFFAYVLAYVRERLRDREKERRSRS